MTETAQAVLVTVAAVCGWFATAMMWRYVGLMPSKEVVFAAAVGAAIPYIPELLALISMPKPVAGVIGACLLAVAYKIVPKPAAESKP